MLALAIHWMLHVNRTGVYDQGIPPALDVLPEKLNTLLATYNHLVNRGAKPTMLILNDINI